MLKKRGQLNASTRVGVILGFLICCAMLMSMMHGSRSGSPVVDLIGPQDYIRPFQDNPRYWQYRGVPVLLLGGSKDDNLFLIDDLEEHLQEIKEAGGNYIRNTLSSRDEGNAYPFRSLDNGKYDLNAWNPDYWQRLENLLEWSYERNIIIQFEIWDRFDYSREFWLRSPWHPTNNINYSSVQVGLDSLYPEHPSRDKQPFFHSVPGMPKYSNKLDLIRDYQERFVDRVLSLSLDYPNILYCMNNETSTPLMWGAYWIDFIKERAAKRGLEIYATDMVDEMFKPQSCGEECATLLQNVDQYNYLDISQINSRNLNQTHWDTMQWILQQRDSQRVVRPANCTKVYGSKSGRDIFGTHQDGVEKFCRDVIGGCAVVRHHRPESGNGLNENAVANIQAFRKAEELLKFWQMRPGMHRLKQREDDEAYLTASDHDEYLVYFPQAGDIELDLTAGKRYQLNWISLVTGQWGKRESLIGGSNRIRTPDERGWLLAITI